MNNHESIIRDINNKINKLNSLGFAVIFMIGGNNSSGKSTVSKQLLCNCSFIQSVNLGVISKMIRCFRKDFLVSSIENFNEATVQSLFDRIIDFFANHYYCAGVNTIFEGVQINSRYLSKNKFVTGGVLLDVSKETAIRRGNFPNTHFKRKLAQSDVVKLVFNEDLKFKVVDNEHDLPHTMSTVYEHLNYLLTNELLKYE